MAEAGHIGADRAERGAILLVARNNLHLTKLAVRSALAQDYPCDLIVIDNASSDGTAQWMMTKTFVSVTCVKQRSLSACWNLGIGTAFLPPLAHKHVLVLNNDVEIRPDAYRLLIAHGGPFVTCVSVRTREELRYPDPPTSESPHPDFSCFLLRQECWRRVGPFDESYYPAFCEDNKMHVKMHRAGIRAVSIDVPFLHHGSATIKACDPAERAVIERGARANREKFKKEFGCYPGTKEYEELFV